MSDATSQVRDLEAPEPDVLEQSLPVDERPVEEPVLLAGEILSGDLEVPESDAIEQHQPAPLDEDDSWR